MKKELGEDIQCPYCGKMFFEGDEVEVYEKNGSFVIYCSGCGQELEVEVHKDGKVYI